MELKLEANAEAFMPVEALASGWGLYHHEPLPSPAERPSFKLLSEEDEVSLEPVYLTGDLAIEARIDKAHNELSFRFLDLNLNAEVMAGLAVLVYYPEERPKNPEHVVLDTRRSKKDLLAILQDWIDRAHERRANAGLKQNKPTQRILVGKYPDYLKAFDLNAEGKSYREIGDALWPGNAGDLEKKAKDYVRQGKKLVENPPLVPKIKTGNSASKLGALSKAHKGE
jgi:hypothetical protein